MTFPFPMQPAIIGYPVVADVGVSTQTSDTTTHPVTLPTGIQIGDLLLLFISIDNNPTNTGFPSGWTQLIIGATTIELDIRYKRVVDLTDVNFSYTSSTSEKAVNKCYLVRNSDRNVAPVATIASGTSVNPDSPNLSTGFSGTKNLWFAAASAPQLASVYPTNYTDNQSTVNSGGTDATNAGLSIATRNLTAAIDNPGTFTIGGSTPWQAATVAIQGKV